MSHVYLHFIIGEIKMQPSVKSSTDNRITMTQTDHIRI